MAHFSVETIHIRNLRVEAIIGIHPEERTTPQPLVINVRLPARFDKAAQNDDIEFTVNYGEIASTIRDYVSQSQFQLLETLIRRLALHLQDRFELPQIDLDIRKPQSIPESDGAAVSLTLTDEDARNHET